MIVYPTELQQITVIIKERVEMEVVQLQDD